MLEWWRVRFVPKPRAPAEEIESCLGPWETVVIADGYQRAVVLAGQVLVAQGPATNRMWWRVISVGLVEDQVVELGVPIQTVGEWCSDPDRVKHAARRAKYGGVCEECGKPTDGSGGPGRAAKRCQFCNGQRLAAETRERSRPARETAERMWREGYKCVEICQAVGWSTRAAGSTIGRRRVLGWDFPQRQGKNAA